MMNLSHRYPKGMQLRFSIAYAALFLPFGIYIPYLQVLLRDLGFSRQEVGLLQGALEVMSVLAPPLWGYLSDRTHRPRTVLAAAVITSTPAFLLYALTDSFGAALAVSILFGFVYRPILPLATGLTFRYIDRHGGDYGAVRVFGSVAFIATCWLLDELGAKEPGGSGLILSGFAAFGIINILCLPLLPRDRVVTGESTYRPDPRLFLNRAFLFFAASAFLSRMAMMSYYQFFTLFLDEELQCESIGLIWAIGPICEIPILLYSRRILDRIGVNRLYLLGLLGVAVRLFGISMASSVWHIIPLQLLHALTFGAYHIGLVTFLSRIVPSHMNSSAQSILAAFSAGLAGMAGGALGGYLAQDYGYPELYTAFALIALASIVPFFLCLRAGRRIKQN